VAAAPAEIARCARNDMHPERSDSNERGALAVIAPTGRPGQASVDVLIAGGGPAGAAAALLLGRAGLTVELVERSRFPREKPCGEGLMPGGVQALARWGLADAVGGAPFVGVRYRAGATVAEGRFPLIEGRAAVGRGQRRLVLDRALFEAAAATAGVRACHGAPVERPILEGGRVVGLVVDGRPRRARLVVAADGLRSPLRRQLGLDGAPPARPRVGLRAHFRLAARRPPVPWVEVYLGRGYELYVTPLPGGELLVAGLAEADLLARAPSEPGEGWPPPGSGSGAGWLAPASGPVDDRPLAGAAARAFAGWIAEQPALAARLAGAEQITRLQGRAPLAATARAGAVPGCVLLGDAAGYVDPITGGGLTQALLAAELLAVHAPALLADRPGALAAFDRARRAMLRDYTLLTRALLPLARRPDLAVRIVGRLARWPALFAHLLGVAGGTGRLLPFAAQPVRPSGLAAPDRSLLPLGEGQDTSALQMEVAGLRPHPGLLPEGEGTRQGRFLLNATARSSSVAPGLVPGRSAAPARGALDAGP
jgi:2-polyprenyl-6-methoxyphenol hydroxylase-like FAD-dependent oxidoreductase